MIASQSIRVVVWGKNHFVEVRQTAKTVWVATGSYNGQRIDAKGSSATSAAAHWRGAAQYKGN